MHLDCSHVRDKLNSLKGDIYSGLYRESIKGGY